MVKRFLELYFKGKSLASINLKVVRKLYKECFKFYMLREENSFFIQEETSQPHYRGN